MSLTKLAAVATICAVLTAAPDAHSWGPERRKVLTPVDSIELVDVLRDGHLQEFKRKPNRTRLSMAWAQVGLENGRGALVYDLNLGNIGPSRYGNDPWYFHVPGARYRAFDDLMTSSRAYWRVIARCGSAMRAFDDGDPTSAARALKRCGYYGAPGPAYEAGLRSLFYEALGEAVPTSERRIRRRQEEEREERESAEVELRFPFTPACGCSRWD